MSRAEDLQDLINLGLDARRLDTHTDEELSMAMCAVQESGTQDAINYAQEHGISDEEMAVNYAESSLGWQT